MKPMAGLIANNGAIAAETAVPMFIPSWCRLIDVIRTEFRKDVQNLYAMVCPELKNWLESATVDNADEAVPSTQRCA